MKILIFVAVIHSSIWGAPPNLKDSPFKKSQEPSKKLVLACYDEFKRECEELKKRLEKCQPQIKVLELPVNPSPSQYSEILKQEKVPAFTPLIIVGHGNKTPRLVGNEQPEVVEKKINNEKEHIHLMTKGGTRRIRGVGGTHLIPDGYYSEDILKEIKDSGAEPSIWFASCYGGKNCESGNQFCIGSICQATEVVTTVRRPGQPAALDRATSAILELYCKKETFDLADVDKSGLVESKELKQYFCNIAVGGRPEIKFYIKRENYEENKEKVRRLVELLLEKEKGTLKGEEKSEFETLVKENDSVKDGKFAFDMKGADFEYMVGAFYEVYKGELKGPISNEMKWTEDPKEAQVVLSRSREPLDSLLKLELQAPNPDSPCMWNYSGKVLKHRPHIENFKLKF